MKLLQEEALKKKKRYVSKNRLIKRVFQMYKRNARNRKTSWQLSAKQFYILSQQTCAYCGAAPANSGAAWNGGGTTIVKEDYKFNGVDRVDNKLGYRIDNCVSCCRRCNYLKGKLSLEEFLWQISAIIPRLVQMIRTLPLKKSPSERLAPSTEDSEQISA